MPQCGTNQKMERSDSIYLPLLFSMISYWVMAS